jgi:hypothetical protein
MKTIQMRSEGESATLLRELRIAETEITEDTEDSNPRQLPADLDAELEAYWAGRTPAARLTTRVAA